VGEEGIGMDGEEDNWPLFSILFLWNHIWSHMTEASRVKDWASCNWRFKNFPGLRTKLTQSEMDERGRRFGCIGHEEVSLIDSVMGHWVKMWSAILLGQCINGMWYQLLEYGLLEWLLWEEYPRQFSIGAVYGGD
jgi:hypothetical protein